MGTPGFLFDMDGVLVDTSDLHWIAWQLLEREDPRIAMSRDGFVRSFGQTNELILANLVPGSSPEDRKRWGARKEELLRQNAGGKVSLLPGMERFLQEVVASKLPHIIASSTPVVNLEFYLKQTPLGKYFDAYASAEEVARGKPYPDVFQEAARRIGLDPVDCIVLEDSQAGLQAGRDAGAFVVALATSLPAEELRNYDALYPSPQELDLSLLVQQWEVWRNER